MRTALSALLLASSLWAQAPADPAGGLIRQGQQQLRAGDTKAALATYRDAVQQHPSSFAAHSSLGVALDFDGQYAEARRHFTEALRLAPAAADRARARRNLAMSYAFERNCQGAAQHLEPLHQEYLGAKDFYMAGEIANELARVCLESSELDTAARWYRRGHEVGIQEPNLKPDRKDLWEFRLAHAEARLAARRGRHEEARKHAAAAQAIFDRGTNPTQAPFVPYLRGYLSFHAGDHRTALAELQQGNQSDAFILSLIAQSHEKLGDQAQAMAAWRKVLGTTAHNPNGAYARPLAAKRLQAAQ